MSAGLTADELAALRCLVQLPARGPAQLPNAADRELCRTALVKIDRQYERETKCLQVAGDIIQNCLGIRPDDQWLSEQLAANLILSAEIDAWGTGDSMTCESVADLAARELTGRKVPTFGEGAQAGTDFYVKLNAAAGGRGWQL